MRRPRPRTIRSAVRLITKVTEKNVRDSIEEIKARSSILRELAASGQVGIVGGMYDVSTGKIAFLAD